jgi:hypothetical protein
MVMRVQTPRFLAIAAIASVLCVVAQAYVGIGGADERTRIVIADCDKNFHVVNLHDLSDRECRSMVRYLARLSTYALLERGPEGRTWINSKLIEQMYLPGAARRIADLDKKDAEYFKERTVNQMPEYREDDIRFRFEQGSFMANVSGALIRDGRFKGRTFRETINFRLILSFSRNPYDGPNSYLPYAVTSFRLNTWIDHGEATL